MKRERLPKLTSASMSALVLIALVIPITAVAGSLAPQSDFALQLSQHELDAVAEVLTSSGSRQYSYRVIGVKKTNRGTRDFEVLSDEKIKGLFLMRNSEYLLQLGISYYDDGIGNLVVLGAIWNGIAPSIPYSVTYSALGDFAYGIGRNGDGVVDVAVGGSGTDSFWILATEDFEQLLECLEERSAEGLLEAASLCIQCIEANRHSNPVSAEDLKCGDSENGRDFGGGGDFHDFLDALREPECSQSEPGKGITSLSAKARRWLRRIETMADWAAVQEWERDADHPLVLAYGDLTTALEDLADAYQEYAENLEDWGAEDSYTRESEQRVRNAIGALNAAWSQLEKASVDAASEEGSNDGTQPSDTERPSIDPLIPPFPEEDPRCQGERTKWEQGSLFGDYCQDKGGKIDPIECIRRMNDSTYSISGGRCWTEVGPDDKKTIVCRNNDDAQRKSESEADPGGFAGPGGANSGPNDGRDLDIGGPKADIHYLDTHPFGGFLFGLCASGRCWDDPPID